MPETPKAKPAGKKNANAPARVPRKRMKAKRRTKRRDVSVSVNVRVDSRLLPTAPTGGATDASRLKGAALYCIKRLLVFFHLL